MDKVNQEEINKIWNKEWRSQKDISPNDILKHKVFLEGYPVLKKFILGNHGQNILEIGSGSGRHGIRIAQDFSQSHVVLTDVSEESLSLIRNLTQKLDIKNIEIKKEDVLNLSFRNNMFDVVFCNAVIQYLPNYELAISEMVRVLKPGGRIILSTVNFWNLPYLFDRKVLRRTNYHYGQERPFKKNDLKKLLSEEGINLIADDGYYFAYGIVRLQYISGFFKLVGKITNRLVKAIDPLTNRFISRNFGFEILVVGEKPVA